MTKSKVHNTSLIIILSFVLVVFIFLIINIINLQNSILYHKSVNWDAKVTDYVGFNLDEDKLHFGGVLAGGRSSRSIKIKVDGEGYLFLTNDKNYWIYANAENPHYLSSSEQELFLVASPPPDTPKGLYEAKVHIYLLKKEPSWFDKLFLKGRSMKKFDLPVKNVGAKINVVNPNSSNFSG